MRQCQIDNIGLFSHFDISNMQFYCNSLTEYKRLATREVKIGDLLLGNFHPIRIQTMTTTDTMDTLSTV